MSGVAGWLGRLPRRVANRIRRARLRGPRVMRAFGRAYPQAVFVQVGSNDGRKHDPLHAALLRHAWSGVMVEPVPYVFARLRENYGAFPRLRLENVAVATAPGMLPFYHLRQAEAGAQLPSWYDELGSFRKDVVLKHRDRIPDIDSRLVQVEIPCVTFAQLCARNGIAAPDLVHIDTEGYDFEIVKSIDLDRQRPLLLVYEHKHLDAAQRSACHDLLRGHGYRCFEEGQDTWCLDTRLRDDRHRRFASAWARIAGRAAS